MPEIKIDQSTEQLDGDRRKYILFLSEAEFQGAYIPMVATIGINTNKTAKPLTPFSFQ